MKARSWRRLGIALGVLVALSTLVAILVPRLLDLNRYHALIVSTVQKAVGGSVRLGRLSWGITPGVWVEVDGIAITDASAFPGDLHASRVFVSVAISPLLHKRIVLNRVVLERPDVRLHLVPSRQAASNALRPPTPCPGPGTGPPCSPDAAGRSTGTPAPVAVEIRHLAIEKGHVVVEDGLTLPGQVIPRAFSDVDITATQGTPGGEIAFDLALRDETPAGLGALKAQGTFRGLTTAFTLDKPHLDARATLSAFHMDAIKPYLRGSPLGHRLGGRASLTMHYDGDLSRHHRAEGSIDVSQLSYTDPSLWPSALPGAEARVTFAVDLTPDELAVENLALKLGKLSVRARGRIPGLGERPVLRSTECSADLPLADLARLIPWKVVGSATATLRPMLENGGRIVIDRAVLPEIALAGPPTSTANVLRKIDVTAQLSGMSMRPSPDLPTFSNIRGTVRLANGIALVQGLRAQTGSVDLPEISAKLTNVFRAPRIEATVKGPLTLPQSAGAEVGAFLRRLGIAEASGAADVDLAVAVDTAQPENFQLQGRVALREIRAKTSFSPARLEGLTADLAIAPGVVQVTTLATTVVVPTLASTPGGRFTVQLQGRLDQWRRSPSITLQRLQTSPLPLPAVAALLPWEKLGGSARPIREVLQAGGTATIDELALPPIKLSAPMSTAQLISRAKGTVTFSDLAVQPSTNLPMFEGIAGRLRLTSGTLTAADVRGRVGPLSVGSPGISATITRLLDKPRVQGTLKGALTLSGSPSGPAVTWLHQIGIAEASGAADVDLAVTVDTAQPENFQLQGHVGLREVKAKTIVSPARLEGLAADLTIAPDAVSISTLATTVVLPETATTPGGRFTVQLQARLNGWHRSPAIVLQHFRTSPISLPVYAELVPWEKLGGSARHVKGLLLSSGTVAIEALTLPPISLTPLPNPAQLIPRVKATVSVTDLAVQPSSTLPKFEGITGHLNLTGGVSTATDVRGRVGPLSLPVLNIRVTDIGEHPKVAVQAKGPLHVAATSDADVEKLLRQYGLRSLTGQAVIDMRADYDRHTPDDWEVHGTLVLGGVRAETYPEAVVMDDLRGRVTVNRGKALDVIAENVTARVNQAPVRISGRFLGLGTPAGIVNATALAKQLNLAHVRAFFPTLKRAGLTGTLDMDLDVSLSLANARKARLSGTLATQGVSFRLPASNVSVKEGDGQFSLSGDSVNIQRLHLRVNDQAADITGHITNPAAPDVQLAVTSPDLDLDRLLPSRGVETERVGSSTERPSQIQVKAGNSGLPPIARNLTGQLQLEAKQGRYRGVTFEDLKLGADYSHGLLTDWTLDFGFGGGRISAKGSADLRDPEQIGFVVHPQITSLKLDELAPVLGLAAVPVTGPISLTGDLQGRTGSTKDLLASLEGNLDTTMGPGRFTRVGRFGAPMAKLLSFASVRGLLSGKLLSDLTGKGLAYRSITAHTSFDRGRMEVRSLSFQSDAFNMDIEGSVNLTEEQLALQVALRPLGTAGKVLGFLPIVGRPAEAMTSIHLEAKGPLDDPEIRLALGQGIERAITGGAQRTGSILKGVTDFLQKGTDKLFGK